MRKQLSLLIAFVLGIGLATALAQKSKDATVVDPDVHNVVLENDHVRVFEARAGAGTKSPMHSHPPFVLASLGSARVKLTLPDGSKQILDLRPGQVMWMENAEHSWELLAGNLHVIAVEVKSAVRPAAGK
ncbi:MAG: hypothetical protein ACRD35_05100 [Candidatus Acidiferrales bacterium]